MEMTKKDTVFFYIKKHTVKQHNTGWSDVRFINCKPNAKFGGGSQFEICKSDGVSSS